MTTAHSHTTITTPSSRTTPSSSTTQQRENTFYVARCDELARLLLHFLEAAAHPETLRFTDRQRLKRLVKRLEEGIQHLTEAL